MESARQRTPDLHAEEARDGMELKQIAGWTVAALLAVAAVAGLARTDFGEKRIAQLSAPVPASLPVTLERTPAQEQAQRLAALREETTAETRKLSEAVKEISAERDKLMARLDALERQVGDVTASIPQRATGGPPIEPAPAAAPVLPPLGGLSAAPAAETSQLVQSHFAVDLGADSSIEALRGRWSRLKAANPKEFDALRPLISVRETGKSGMLELRLIVGPLADAATAARLCARLATAGKFYCEPAAFDGQRLATR